MCKKTKKRIALVFDEDYLGSYPSFIESISILSKNGYSVDIIGVNRCTNFPKPPEFEKNVNFISLHLKSTICRDYSNDQFTGNVAHSNSHVYKTSLLKSFIPQKLKSYFRNKINNVNFNIATFNIQKTIFIDSIKYIFFVLITILRRKYDIVIGVDLGGGCAAYISSLILSTDKLVYWGLEITTKQQPMLAKKLLKFFEIRMCKKADLLLSTDLSRIKDVCNENNTSLSNRSIICLPHSPSGFSTQFESVYFQQMFSLDMDSIIILHSGWIHEVMQSKSLAQASRGWPNEWKLVFHERMTRNSSEPYIKEVENAGGQNLYLSLNPVQYNKIDKVIASSTIGVVIYGNSNEWGTSWVSLAKGSGKIAHYLKCGKPVVCVNIPGLKEIVTKYQCGILFNDVNEIHSAILEILKNYSFYSSNALKCYKNEYEFSNYFNNFLEYTRN
jgi:glycosyltransferase involved in cell wall biosynthesis